MQPLLKIKILECVVVAGTIADDGASESFLFFFFLGLTSAPPDDPICNNKSNYTNNLIVQTKSTFECIAVRITSVPIVLTCEKRIPNYWSQPWHCQNNLHTCHLPSSLENSEPRKSQAYMLNNQNHLHTLNKNANCEIKFKKIAQYLNII